MERDVNIHNDYSTGGSLLPGRSFNSSEYRYGWNKGSEKDDEITGVTGSHYTTYFREYDTRLNRTWSIDPVFQPWQSPYTSMDNNPIWFNVPLGDKVKAKLDRKQRKELGISRKEAKNYTPDKIVSVFKDKGLDVSIKDGWLQSTGESKATTNADKEWAKLLDPSKKFRSVKLKFKGGTGETGGGFSRGRTASIYLNQINDDDLSIKGFNYNNVPAKAFGLGTLLDHEALGHSLFGLLDPESAKEGAEKPGETVDYVNENSRKQNNLPFRSNYGETIFLNKKQKIGRVEIHFSNGGTVTYNFGGN
ncbi:MAG: hypothetical protein A3K10_08720 [Bacteroidetes bacterium RIFCSPLOWO2_12_FULL_31_6]|nr:MAG: hypothetical protein A3K10_08720 [Bacteroidetes bacterium RIFCSPLOWO2_12_FULL_31_6]